MPKTWFITGAARGLGAEVARAALAAGDNVVATALDEKDVHEALTQHTDRLLAAKLDVTDSHAPTRAVESARARFGRIDVLVNNAGYGHLGIFEESSEDDVQRQFAINIFGMMRVTRAVLPVMRAQLTGHIINFSSINGLVAFDLCTLYGTSKSAVEGFSANLARDVEPFGVHVTIVEPGFFRTDFLDPTSAKFSHQTIVDYDQARQKAEAAYQKQNHKQPGDPARLGPAIVELSQAAEPPRRLLLGTDALGYARQELSARLAEIDKWEKLSASTDLGENA